MRPGVGECKAFPSIWGHWAGGTKGHKVFAAFIITDVGVRSGAVDTRRKVAG